MRHVHVVLVFLLSQTSVLQPGVQFGVALGKKLKLKKKKAQRGWAGARKVATNMARYGLSAGVSDLAVQHITSGKQGQEVSGIHAAAPWTVPSTSARGAGASSRLDLNPLRGYMQNFGRTIEMIKAQPLSLSELQKQLPKVDLAKETDDFDSVFEGGFLAYIQSSTLGKYDLKRAARATLIGALLTGTFYPPVYAHVGRVWRNINLSPVTVEKLPNLDWRLYGMVVTTRFFDAVFIALFFSLQTVLEAILPSDAQGPPPQNFEELLRAWQTKLATKYWDALPTAEAFWFFADIFLFKQPHRKQVIAAPVIQAVWDSVMASLANADPESGSGKKSEEGENTTSALSLTEQFWNTLTPKLVALNNADGDDDAVPTYNAARDTVTSSSSRSGSRGRHGRSSSRSASPRYSARQSAGRRLTAGEQWPHLQGEFNKVIQESGLGVTTGPNAVYRAAVAAQMRGLPNARLGEQIRP
ncbi:unnamed protein product [Amoebophrya sp. A120]|nr:unnamed protein product [Amoebophrya sp. A120]|eukprot:GSA120T00022384001.1